MVIKNERMKWRVKVDEVYTSLGPESVSQTTLLEMLYTCKGFQLSEGFLLVTFCGEDKHGNPFFKRVDCVVCAQWKCLHVVFGQNGLHAA